MHRSRLVATLGVLAAAVSLALPFVTFPGMDGIGGIEGAAWPVMLLLCPVLLLLGTGDRIEAPSLPVASMATGLAVGALVFAIVKLADSSMAASDAGGSVGPGAWFLVIGAAVTVTGAALGFSRRI